MVQYITAAVDEKARIILFVSPLQCLGVDLHCGFSGLIPVMLLD